MRTLPLIPYFFTVLIAAQAHAEWVCNWTAPEYLDKVEIVYSPELKKLRQCEYSMIMSALVVGANADMQDSCSFHDLAFARALGCLSPLDKLVIEKLFYEIYPIAREDLGNCKGQIPIVIDYQSFSRKDVMEQCPDVKPLKHKDTILSADTGDGPK